LAAQQKLGLLPQQRLGVGAVDYFAVDVHRSSLMTDLLRRSAANLLAISLAMAADLGEAQDELALPADESTGQSNPSPLPNEEEGMELERK
jgi:hypothetical protein